MPGRPFAQPASWTVTAGPCEQQRAELLALVQQVASGGANAAAVVDEIARRLAG